MIRDFISDDCNAETFGEVTVFERLPLLRLPCGELEKKGRKVHN